MRMDVEIKDKVGYIIAVISEFAEAHSLTTSQAYRYLDRFQGIDLYSQSTAYVYEYLEKELATGKLA